MPVSAAAIINFTGDELLGRPTDTAITINIIPDTTIEYHYQFGTTSDVYTRQTANATAIGGEPHDLEITELLPNTQYFYRMRYHAPGDGPEDWVVRGEHSFWTQRSPGSTFSFALTADTHPNVSMFFNAGLYSQTLNNILADQPDFLIDLGDTNPNDYVHAFETTRQNYLTQRVRFDEITHSGPLFLIVGNHENEEGWHVDDDEPLPIWSVNARKMYYPNPIPDGFYSANDDTHPDIIDDGYLENYYAWEWGDALFVVIDPYWYTLVWPSEGDSYGAEFDEDPPGDRWDWTLGDEQYLWFKEILEDSNAKYKFVFTHQVTGGTIPYGRGGEAAAPYFEWGGLNWDGTEGFAAERPGWEMPVHDLMVANNVDFFFHGHDHCFAKEDVDGIVYIEVPLPGSIGNNGNGNYDYTGFCLDDPYAVDPANNYPNADIMPCSGHIRVTVSPDDVVLEYVRAYLPGDGTNGEIAYSYNLEAEDTGILGDVNGDYIANSTDALTLLAGDAGLDVSAYCPMYCGDVNGDGLVNSTDAIIILSYEVGLSVPFPVSEPGCPESEPYCLGCSP